MFFAFFSPSFFFLFFFSSSRGSFVCTTTFTREYTCILYASARCLSTSTHIPYKRLSDVVVIARSRTERERVIDIQHGVKIKGRRRLRACVGAYPNFLVQISFVSRKKMNKPWVFLQDLDAEINLYAQNFIHLFKYLFPFNETGKDAKEKITIQDCIFKTRLQLYSRF